VLDDGHAIEIAGLGRTTDVANGGIATDTVAETVVFAHQRTQFPETAGDDVEYRLVAAGWRLLRKTGDTRTLTDAALTAVGLDFAIDDAQQRGFAGAIASDQANTLTGTDVEIDTVQQRRDTIG
jgi:hypothetical protein